MADCGSTEAITEKLDSVSVFATINYVLFGESLSAPRLCAQAVNTLLDGDDFSIGSQKPSVSFSEKLIGIPFFIPSSPFPPKARGRRGGQQR